MFGILHSVRPAPGMSHLGLGGFGEQKGLESVLFLSLQSTLADYGRADSTTCDVKGAAAAAATVVVSVAAQVACNNR